MKPNPFVVLLTVLMFFGLGCTQQFPVENVATDAPPPGGATMNNGAVELIKLPVPKVQIARTTITKLVVPGDSTDFYSMLTYQNLGKGTTKYDVKFKVPKGAVSAPVLITMILDTAYAKIEFFPEGLQFLKPASIDVTLIGLDPITKGNAVEFFYLNPNGTFNREMWENMFVTPNKGNIQMKGGVITHFSAYAFGRRKEMENHK